MEDHWAKACPVHSKHAYSAAPILKRIIREVIVKPKAHAFIKRSGHSRTLIGEL